MEVGPRSAFVSQEKYIGMDVHQATIAVAVMDTGGKLMMECLLETKAAGVPGRRKESMSDSLAPPRYHALSAKWLRLLYATMYTRGFTTHSNWRVPNLCFVGERAHGCPQLPPARRLPSRKTRPAESRLQGVVPPLARTPKYSTWPRTANLPPR